MPKRKPILCLDFDGVINSYVSGWQGPRTLPDPPVPGALEFISQALDEFAVAVYSSRSYQWGGRRAMRTWLERHMTEAIASALSGPKVRYDRAHYTAHPILRWLDLDTMEPVELTMREGAQRFVDAIEWPTHKPPALVTLDDRAIQFSGTWPELADLRAFRPWNKS